MPAPTSASRVACSSRVTAIPLRASAIAAVRPPIPPPTTMARSLLTDSGCRELHRGLGLAHHPCQLVVREREQVLILLRRPHHVRLSRVVRRLTDCSATTDGGDGLSVALELVRRDPGEVDDLRIDPGPSVDRLGRRGDLEREMFQTREVDRFAKAVIERTEDVD